MPTNGERPMDIPAGKVARQVLSTSANTEKQAKKRVLDMSKRLSVNPPLGSANI